MNEAWNLDPIYHGFDDPAFAEDLQNLRQLAKQYNDFAAKLTEMDSLEGLKQGLVWQEQLTAQAMKLFDYAQLRQSVNTRDSQAGSYIGQTMQILSTTAGAEAAWKAWAAAQPGLMELVREEESLREYTFLFENLLKGSTHLLGEKGEEIAAKLAMSGGNAWAELHGYLTSTVPVQYGGETINLPAVRNLAYDEDPAVRKAAYEAEIACYDRIKDPVAFALNSIKLETISDCQLRGYASPLDRTLEHSYMKRETLEAMLAAMEEYLPSFWAMRTVFPGTTCLRPWASSPLPTLRRRPENCWWNCSPPLTPNWRIWSQRPLTKPGSTSIPVTAKSVAPSALMWAASVRAAS